MIRRVAWLVGGVALLAAFAASVTVALFAVRQATDRGGNFDPSVRGAEWHRRGLRTMEELFPTRTVSRGGAVAELPRALLELDDVAWSVAGEPRDFATFLERNHTHGIVVLHRGRIVYERYFEGADETSRFTSWSVAKSFTATLVGMAEADGQIGSLADPLGQYVPSLRGTGYEPVTIDQALRMVSGIGFSEEYDQGTSDVAGFMTGSVITQRESADELAVGFPAVARPGSVFNYNTAETQVLGLLLRTVTGTSHAELLSRKIWRPLGMEHDATIVLDRPGPEGVEMAGCCLNAALRDWARFGQLHLQDGVWGGARILPEGWVARATSAKGAPAADAPSTDAHYRYQWWLFDRGRYAAEGVHGQYIFVDPAAELVVAKASFWPVAWDDALAEEALAAFGALGQHLGGGAP